jgi:transcriptional regulator with XRE-family HTH domain
MNDERFRKEFGRRLGELRRSQRLSQEELAELTRRSPEFKTLRAVSEALRITPERLFQFNERGG